ncbi:acetyl-CoA synthetase-like protein [Anaeromyces robustus]|uniref:Acetyl-CoA synthetase-like protein n=1 Tax=Anaeromyces robustus TaxID=1754192 RepID=A0A1Y1WVE4_9FUNG|nr:acetyl-CoA synthetase-like protein [Anaeromyces robustus]|eukprot:ORX77432.1 acetyl-CoA synthetase-like protein [Anaeromyces robustus]
MNYGFDKFLKKNKNLDVAFRVMDQKDGYLISLDYNTNLYDDTLIQNILESFIEVFVKVPDNYGKILSDIEYISEKEKNKILYDFNENIYDYGYEKIYPTEFSKIAKLNAEKTALVFKDQKFTYGTLNEMTNSLGHYLRKLGVKRNEVIPIICERSYYYVIASIAIMKAGGVFLFIDPEFPKDRVKYMVNEVKAKIILEYIPHQSKENTFDFDDSIFEYSLDGHDYRQNTHDVPNVNTSDDICCMFFTSGTTGKPKGILINHDNVINSTQYALTYQGGRDVFGNPEAVLAFSKFTYVMCFAEIFFPLIKHVIVVLCSEEEYNNPSLLGDIILKYNTEIAVCTSTRIRNYLNNEKFRKAVANFKTLFFGGESLTRDVLQLFIQHTNDKIYYSYALTETTAFGALSYISHDDIINNRTISIGKPACNYQVYILDENYKPVPVGVEGEIYLGGRSICSGYLNLEKLTKETFIDCPYSPYKNSHKKLKMYGTGDLGKWTPDGRVIHLGRKDFQVKIRGQRIELPEIEQIVKEIKGIDYTVVIDKMKKGSNEKYLVGYYITKSNNITGEDIRNYLKTKLPMYMIPSYFIQIDKVPVTAHGKLDRKSLPEPDIDRLLSSNYVAPETKIEKTICKIYSQAFHIDLDKIGKYSTYFEIGGTSLSAIKTVAAIEKELKIKLNIKDIFTYPKVCDLGKRIEEIQRNGNNHFHNKVEIIKKQNKKEFPVTTQQLGVYIDSIKNPESTIYNIPSYFQLNHNIDIEKIKKGFTQLFEKQEILRTKYIEKEINNKIEIYGEVDDECQLKFENYTYDNKNEFVRPFDLSKAPLIRIGFIENEVLLVDMHHIISDGSTILALKEQLNHYYNTDQVHELDIQYSDYALHRKNNETEKDDDSDIFVLNKNIDKSASHLINEYVKSHGISKTAFFITIYGYVLSKYSGQDRIYSSIMSANRHHHSIENMFGMFVSTLPILLKYDHPDTSFLTTIKQNMNMVMEIYNNQELSFSELSRLLNLKNMKNSFIYQPKNKLEEKSSTVSSNNGHGTDIFVSYEDPNELNRNDPLTKFDYTISINYNHETYDSKIIRRILDSYEVVIRNIMKFDDPLKTIEYIPEGEKIQMMEEFNRNSFTYDFDRLYHVEFSKLAKEIPDQCAVVFNDTIITYRELDEMSNSLTYYLRKQNIGRNAIVPIICERSYYFIVAFIAVLKSGAAYLQIDPDFPMERIEYMVREVNAKFVLEFITDKENRNKVQFKNKGIVEYQLQHHKYDENTFGVDNVNVSDDLSYVLFTSGTTGMPKGTLLTHNNLINYCLYCQKINGQDDLYEESIHSVLAFSKFTFDMSLSEIHYPLLRGNKIVLSNDEEFNDPIAISKLIQKHQIDCLWSVPSRIENYINYKEFLESIQTLKFMLLGGEKLEYQLVKKLINNNIKVLNGYGPTETTVCCIIKKYTKENIENDYKNGLFNSIGKPLCNTKVYILDKYLKPVPIGVEGEIFIGGYGVGKGYLHRENLTKEKFLENPFNFNYDDHNNMMYRTGDLGQWTENGEIEYLGRIDFQVKIHGQRIELGEIENTVNEVSGIQQSIVIDSKKENGEKYLICYFISSNDDDEIQVKDIKEYLKKKLPLYMIPNYYKRIQEIPLTSNGKLDRKALPESSSEDLNKERYVAPETEIEKCICQIYSEMFNMNESEIGVMSDFYELGGNSLNAIRVTTRNEKELDIKLNIKDILLNSVIYDFGKRIEEIINNDEGAVKAIQIIEKQNKLEFPVTAQQLGVYIDTIKNPDTIIYNVPSIFKFKDNVDIEMIKCAIGELLQKQEILRSKYIEKEVNGEIEVYGCIDNECRLKFESYTFDNVKNFIRPFNLSKAPLIRVGFIEDKVLLIDMHHIISDGVTSTIIMNELNHFYNDDEVDELEVQFSDYALYMDEKKKEGYFENQIEFYCKMFECEYEIIDSKLSQAINEYTKNNGISKTAFYVSIYGYILSRYSGQDIIYSSIISANRNNRYVENMIGMFVSTLPILLKYENENEKFIDIIKRNMNLLVNIYDNQDISLSDITKALKLPNINNAFVYQPNIKNVKNIENNIFDLDGKVFDSDRNILNEFNNVSKFDLLVDVSENDYNYTIHVEYNKNLYDDSMINKILDSYIEVIKNISHFEEMVKDIEYIPELEKENILLSFNKENIKYDFDKLYHVEFSKVAKKYPNRNAIIYQGMKFTFKEIDEMSNSLAFYLRSKGVGKGDIVPILCDRSYLFVVATLAVMKSGSAYLPIDPEFPSDRIEYIINEANPKIILKYLATSNNKDIKLNHVEEYLIENHNYSENIEDIENVNEGDDLIYILYTSGTTGKPKGTLVTHNNLINYCLYSQTINGKDYIYEKNINNALVFSKFTFDMSMGEVYYPLLKGTTLVLCSNEEFNSPDRLSSLISTYDVDYIFSVPSRIENYMKFEKFRNCIKNVKWILFGGEYLNLNLIRELFKYSDAEIINGYGPTEATVICTSKQFSKQIHGQPNEEILITIGKPLCNCKVYILDKYLKPVPVGVEGEIYVGGYGVGKGYFNRKELTQERYIENPFNFDNEVHNRIMYKTGDIGKWTENGEVEYLGRIDFQVKIRGQRIELGEIENTVKEIEDIESSVVIDKFKENGEKYLTCYFITTNDEIQGKYIREYLKKKLPLYMVPNYYKRIQEIPLTSNGKLDRRSLPEPNIEDLIKEKYIAPESEIEKCICQIYSEIFDIDSKEIGVMSDFFELGGDSLNAIRVISKIEKELNVKLSIKDILLHSVISQLGKHIEEILNNGNGKKDIEIIEKQNKLEFPITAQQLGVYIDSIKHPNTIIYNIPSIFKLNEGINIEKIKEAINQLFENQEIFRSKYEKKEINGQTEVYGFIDNECSLEFESYTFENVKSFVRPFDLSKAPLIRVGFIEDKILLIDIHHIIADGTTTLIITNELNKYYYDNEIDELQIQYSDYAISMDEKKKKGYFENQIEFYRKMFECDYEILNIPKKENININEDSEEDNEINTNIGNNTKIIDVELSEKINEYIKNNGISKTAFFISIYGYVLSKYSGQDIIYSSIVSANRNNGYVENMIGMFVSTLPILLKYENEDEKFIDTIKRNMNLLVDMYDNQDISLSEIFNLLKLKKLKNSFIYQPYLKSSTNDNMEGVITENEVPLNVEEIVDENNNKSKFNLTCEVVERENNYTIVIEYNRNIYDNPMINRIIDSFIEVIKNISSFEEQVKNIEYIPSDEKEKIINGFNNDVNIEGNDNLYHIEFSRIAKENPNKCAIVYNESTITYNELDKMSNSLAHYLRKCGITRNDIVPVICDRSPYFIISTLAISKAGGAFLPIDKKLPIERIQFILNEVQPKIILFSNTQNVINSLVELNENYVMYDLKQHDYKVNINSSNNINEDNDTCYVLFTSGTTGKPKGVLVSHFNIYNNIRQFNNNSNLSVHGIIRKDNVSNMLALTNFSFDIYHNEITLSLVNGLTIVLVDNLYLDYFLEDPDFRKSLSLIKTLILLGEDFSINLCKEIHKYSNCKIYNGYGPTECTVTSTYKEIDDTKDSKVTIGKPQCNYKGYLLDKYLKPVPIGVEGELFISGYGIGKGYLNREELTKEKFIKNPFNFDNNKYCDIMYRTGDLGKWTENGDIEYLGRIDFQVKIHGQRIELGEIESIIKEIEGIVHCIVIDKKKENEEKFLMCYFVSSDEQINGKEIREYLKKKLPLYMVPNYYKRIYEIPLTISGKLNRKELPEPDLNDYIKEKYVAPETEIEKCICKIYSEIFNIDSKEIGIMSDFFELGGDSLNAIRVITKIEKEFNIRLTIKDINSYSVIYNLGQHINEILNNETLSREIEIIEKQNKLEFPVTSQQLGVYIDSSKNPNTIIYNEPSLFKLNEGVDIEKVKEGLIKVFNNHEILRSRYEEKEVNGEIKVYGFIDNECSLEFESYTFENVNSFVRPFDVSKAPLIRVGFIENRIILFDVHHIIYDGASLLVIMNELNNYYYDNHVDKLEVQFSDYAIYMNDKKNHGYFDSQIKFYHDMFDCDYELLNIPKKEKNSENKEKNTKNNNNHNSNIKYSSVTVDSQLCKTINKYVKNNGISKTSFFISIYGYVLSKFTGQNTIYTSTINANRYSQYVENMIGMFVSTIPLLLKYNENEKFIDILKRNTDLLFNAYNNQDVSLTEIFESLKIKTLDNTIIYQPYINTSSSNKNNIFVNENEFDEEMTSLMEEIMKEANNISKFDFVMMIIENSNDCSINVLYNKDLYNDKIINEIVNSYVEVMKSISKFGEEVKSIEYIPEHEKTKIVKEFNDNHFDYDFNKLYHEEFDRIAHVYPEKCAIINNGIKITYKKLYEMSNSLAHYLRKQNIGRGDIVPVISVRSYYFIVAILGIMKSGAAYLPIDPEFPEQRIKYMVNEVNAKLIIKYVLSEEEEEKENKLKFDENIKTYALQEHDYTTNIESIEYVNQGDDLCYILFTSGTTGKPKGTMITHSNLINYCLYSQTFNGEGSIYDEDFDNVLGICKFTHDISIGEINYPLLRGSTIILGNDEDYNNPELLSNLITKYNVDYIFTVPSRMENYLKFEKFSASLRNVKWVLLGGEKVENTIVKNIQNCSNGKVCSVYGPTETSVVSNIKVLDRDPSVITIGKPLCNFQIYILDHYLRPVPVGIEGEICIGGYGVGKGYLNQKELTNEKFVENPFNFNHDEHNRIIYRTGDIGKWTENGEIICIGRYDFQVKIRGQRIELGEIENTVKEIEGIENSVVLCETNENGDKYIICYYLTSNNIESNEIKNYLKDKLPKYMIPRYFIRIYELPLTNNGKLDKKALPKPNIEDLNKEKYVAPVTETEKIICKIYSDMFNMAENEIGIMSDFYELGGNSLNAIRTVAEIKKFCNVHITMKDVMKNSTIKDLAMAIENIKLSNKFNSTVIEKRNQNEFPSTSILSNFTYNANHFDLDFLSEYSGNMVSYYQLPKDVQIQKLTDALAVIFDRHDILRSYFIEKEINGKYKMFVKTRDHVEVKIEEYTIENFSKFIRPFDITKDLLIRVGMINKSVLMIDMDHRIADGYSFGILINELNVIYNNGKLEELPIQYSDYAIYYDELVHSESYSNQMNYYQSLFEGYHENLRIITKENSMKSESENEKKKYNEVSITTDTEFYDKINSISKKYGLSKTAILLTVYSLILSIYSNNTSIYTALISSNRNNSSTENLIGLFAKYIPILVKIEDLSLIDIIKNVMNMLLTVYDYNLPFSTVSETLGLPTCNSWFKFDPYEMQGGDDVELGKHIRYEEIFEILDRKDLLNVTSDDEELTFKGTKDLLTLENSPDFMFIVYENKDNYKMSFIYNEVLYNSELIKSMLNNYVSIIKKDMYFRKENIIKNDITLIDNQDENNENNENNKNITTKENQNQVNNNNNNNIKNKSLNSEVKSLNNTNNTKINKSNNKKANNTNKQNKMINIKGSAKSSTINEKVKKLKE